MRNLIAVLVAMVFPWSVSAQDMKPIQLSDYVSFCLAMWGGSPDIQAKANALGLQNAFPAVATVTIGKSTLQYFKSGKENEIVGAIITIFADGQESWCEVTNPSIRVDRADLESMQRALNLDGQILPLGAATVGYWKMSSGRTPVLLKAVVSSRVVTLNMMEFEPAANGAKQSY